MALNVNRESFQSMVMGFDILNCIYRIIDDVYTFGKIYFKIRKIEFKKNHQNSSNKFNYLQI